ncbi:MAG: putative HD phosphohydrolase [Gammaproteobacteria bacterium]|jgi:predicted HD phosphohydrolase
MKQVKFSQMKDGDKADYEFLEKLEHGYIAQLPSRIVKALEELEDSFSGYKISRLDHSLQSATMAWRGGADTDWVIAALVHDVGDGLAPYAHDKFAAEIIRPFVREQCTWVVENHFDFQKYYFNHFFDANRFERDKHKDSPYFDDCVNFCELWDQSAFDPDYEQLPLEFFEPIINEVFTRKPFLDHVIQTGTRLPLQHAEKAKERKSALN